MKKNKIIEKFSVVIITLIVYICYFNAVKAIYPGYIKLLIIAVGLLCIYFFLNKKKTLKIPIYYLILPIMIAISEIYTISSFSTSRYLIIYTLLLSIAILITQIENWKKIFIKVILVFSIITMMVTILSFFSNSWYISKILPLIDQGSRVIMRNLVIYADSYPGLFASTGVNAFFISVGLAIVFINLINDKRNRKINMVLFILFILALFLTLKRAALLINLFIILVMSIFRNKRILKNIIITIMLLIFLITMMITIFPDIYFNLINRFVTNSAEELLNGRGDLYKFAIEKIYENPLKGLGFGAFSKAYSESTNYKGVLLDTHNEFLQLCSELGIIQGAIVIFAVLKVYYDCLILFIKNTKEENSEQKKFVSVALYVQSYFIIYCIIGNPFHDTTIFFIAMLCGVMCEELKMEQSEQ